MSKIQINSDRLVKNLKEQLTLIKNACKNYDNGEILEAKNISNRIRLFIHNTSNSVSLAKQLGIVFRKSLIIETIKTGPSQNTIFYLGVTLKMSPNEIGFVPMFETKGKPMHEVSYKDWWNEVLIIIEGKKFTRRDIILTYNNQDGGSHVDPSIDEDYKKLTEGELLKIKRSYKDERNIDIPEKDIPHVVVRQSAFFLIKGLIKQYNDLLSTL